MPAYLFLLPSMSRPSPPKSASSLSSSSSWRSPSRRPSSGSLGDSPAGSLRASPAPPKEDALPRRWMEGGSSGRARRLPALPRRLPGGRRCVSARRRTASPLRSARPARLAYRPARLRRRLPSRPCDRGPSKSECLKKTREHHTTCAWQVQPVPRAKRRGQGDKGG